ncbi:MAG: hypothetical protein ACT4PL_00610 [Phycisphaerales bacterium]
MSKTKDPPGVRVDEIMERASRALVERHYFESERLCVEALELAHTQCDFERMARICLPLQESRRQKRDLAVDSRRIFVVDDQLPKVEALLPGCYLIRPPRVGLDGRMLREMADRTGVPIIVVTREPTTRTGHWPVVALGPLTIRARVAPPRLPPAPASRGRRVVKKGVPRHAEPHAPARAASTMAAAGSLVEDVLPPIEWFLNATEALGDAAIATVDPSRPGYARVEDFLLRVAAHPDHEKLHQRLAEACMDAAREGPQAARARAGLDDAEDEGFPLENEAEPEAGEDEDSV